MFHLFLFGFVFFSFSFPFPSLLLLPCSPSFPPCPWLLIWCIRAQLHLSKSLVNRWGFNHSCLCLAPISSAPNPSYSSLSHSLHSPSFPPTPPLKISLLSPSVMIHANSRHPFAFCISPVRPHFRPLNVISFL
ncbi:uncharacterized protein BO95DRAFT_217625 [Aspergillus brunneoviolaceus CBS 621.78]|uniref:Uncharacterized protein n=1 Tax=Aspergillus brunneoviolaceus CBS 621.78 TaxID=1450534 RepID=A0ACD1G1A5_9EURO|nr:hypothetical protein BO95DRAFT_217625 [Aspergillus brunneoviolaceus CBS 621.78]RAH42948.1 hypothetical protein BO95DRAFT_217625 [Aspergillus brunneoviolaceus CBS 621.78]